MAAISGRDVRIMYDSGAGMAVIAGARADNITINRGMVDITDKDDDGVRTLLDDIGTFSASMTVSGILVGTVLPELAKSVTAGAQLLDFSIDFITLGVWDGDWFISNFEAGGEDGEGVATFSCTLESSGTITHTPG